MKSANLAVTAANLMQSAIDKDTKVPAALVQFVQADEFGNRYLLFPELIAMAEEPTVHPKPLPFVVNEQRQQLLFDYAPPPQL